MYTAQNPDILQKVRILSHEALTTARLGFGKETCTRLPSKSVKRAYVRGTVSRRMTYLRNLEELEEVGNLDGGDAGGRPDHSGDHLRLAAVLTLVLRSPDVADGTCEEKQETMNSGGQSTK